MICETEDQYAQFMLSRATLPPLTSGDTFHWDGGGPDSQGVELTQGAAPAACAALPVHGQQDAGLSQACRRDVGVSSPALPVPAIDWARAAASFTFYLDPTLLLPSPGHAVFPAVTGTLLWVYGQEDGASITPAVHPALLVRTASASRQEAYVELVPHVPCDDPLQHHITMVLQAAVAAEDRAGQFYAEALAKALADHLLRRYAACRPSERVCSGGLPPFKLQRTIAYIRAHLEHALSLSELAAVTQMSPSHFAHRFKQATGQTPHQYVTLCRMERAKHLLTETALPLYEIGAAVGCADQSHFTALFRRYVTTTPRAYREALGGGLGTPPVRVAADATMGRRHVTNGVGSRPSLPAPYVMGSPPARGAQALLQGRVPISIAREVISADCGKENVYPHATTFHVSRTGQTRRAVCSHESTST